MPPSLLDLDFACERPNVREILVKSGTLPREEMSRGQVFSNKMRSFDWVIPQAGLNSCDLKERLAMKEFGSPVWTRFELLRRKSLAARTASTPLLRMAYSQKSQWRPGSPSLDPSRNQHFLTGSTDGGRFGQARRCSTRTRQARRLERN